MEKPTPTWLIPGYPSLKAGDDVGRAAMQEQVVEYPKIVRQDVDTPIVGQRFGNVSFMLFNEPKMLKNGKPCFGFVKLRGNHESELTARNDSYRIVRKLDSKFQVKIAPVGAWVPITEDNSVIQDLYDVRESNQEIHLRDEAVKQKEEEIQKISRELKEAEENLKTKGDIYDDQESLRFYSMKRVTEMRLYESIYAQRLKLKELDKKLAEQRIILKKLEKNHDSYSKEWVDCYNEERSKTSLSKFIPGSSQFDDYEDCTLESLLREYPENI